MIKKLELSYKEFIDIKKYCDKKNIIFLSTPHSYDAIDFLYPLVPAYKIASGDLNNLPFLARVARKKKPIFLSTGMSTLGEVREAVNVIKEEGNNEIVILHCTSNYPCPLGEVNLRAMETLRKKLDLPVGYSDHTQGVLIPIMAVAMGAVLIEKHFTLDKKLKGPDHKASLGPKELERMVKCIRGAEKAVGSKMKRPTKSEERLKRVVRKSIVAKIDIQEGARLSLELLAIKRSGSGISPKYIDGLVGKKAASDIKRDELITWDKIKV